MSGAAPDLERLLRAWRKAAGPEAAAALLEGAEALLGAGAGGATGAVWHDYLSLTRKPAFLGALTDDAARLRWAETTFAAIERTGFGLGALFEQRCAENPDRILFQELSEPGAGAWTYAQIRRRVRATAAVFLKEGAVPQLDAGVQPPASGPRVGLLCNNSVASACCDLACLTHDLFVSPLSPHFGVDDLAWICDRLALTVLVCDSPELLEKLIAAREKTRRGFVIYALHPCARVGDDDVRLLDAQLALLDGREVGRLLDGRSRRSLREVATVMFTSGSTGRPKGVAFSEYNLVSKRFARAAALPAVGDDEVLLCYLPLFHTFGRYLEMLGMVFWGGTYVFAGNPSADTLMTQLRDVRPTGLISVPVRWVQIRDRVLELARDPESDQDHVEIARGIVGDRLAWGLSAAGYLDPRVFRFFHRCGVRLCSGFGMTEGTGGLTMTPPDDYVEDSVGVPLPGTRVRFSDEGELQIAGPYIARYLPSEAPDGSLTVAEPESDLHWLPTGDLFRRTTGEHLEIVDRIKDIYKNNRGQTIAPRVVESRFDQVPGIERSFLVGDGRSYNTLLIVPDETDEVLQSLATPEARREYYQRIVTMANADLAPPERVVDFAVLPRDFSAEKGELTAKGSYRRKDIARNFGDTIAELYRSSVRKLTVGDLKVLIPRWFYRDMGVLDDAIRVEGDDLVNRETAQRLRVARGEAGRVRIGDFEYVCEGDVVDLGLLVRQPLLWMANARLVDFGPCRAGWDTATAPFTEQVFLPEEAHVDYAGPPRGGRVERQLRDVDQLCRQALFGHVEEALTAIAELNEMLGRVGSRQGEVIRRRLEALARHPVKSVRCRAYQVLVLDQPVPDYLRYLPAFIDSGLTFLDEESFAAISRAAIEPRRLQALRQRLHSYRTQLDWPAPPRTRRVFEDLFRLLANFGRAHPEFYSPIREELVSWVLHDGDPELAAAARLEFNELSEWFEAQLAGQFDGMAPAAWRGKIVFQEGLSDEEVARLREILVGTNFLQQSLILAFECDKLTLANIGRGGIWVSRIISRYQDQRYRVSVNTRSGEHYDLQLIVRRDFDQAAVQQTIYWYIALRGYPFGTPMLPAFGCCRPELGALSMAYVSDLTVWEKIREFSSVRGPGTQPPSRMRWHQLLVQAMAVVVRGWRNSERRIIPGLITPNNIVVPEPDYRQGAIQNSLSGWRAYSGPLSLMRPLWRNIYQHTLSHYPWSREYLEREWIFESFVEELGVEGARTWFGELLDEMTLKDAEEMGLGFIEALTQFQERLDRQYYQPLNLRAAIVRYRDWRLLNTQAPLRARLDVLEELSRLYRLDRLPEIARYTLFRHTYFQNADLAVLDIFDRLLVRMFRHPDGRATQMVELSDLQAALNDPDDLTAFNRLAFPLRPRGDAVEVRKVGDPERGRVIMRSTIRDQLGRTYAVGEPSGPAEVGHLYRLFFKAGFPKTIGDSDRYLVVTDEAEQIVGGAVYHEMDETSIFLDGIVVAQALAARGIESAILADLCTRVSALGFNAIKTHFFLRTFFEQHGFRLDQRWGGLVRFL